MPPASGGKNISENIGNIKIFLPIFACVRGTFPAPPFEDARYEYIDIVSPALVSLYCSFILHSQVIRTNKLVQIHL